MDWTMDIGNTNMKSLPIHFPFCRLQSQQLCIVWTANNNLLHSTQFEVECKAFDNNGPQLSVRGQAPTHTLSLLCGQALTLTHSSTAAGKKSNGLWASRGGRGRACK